jgi:transketolase
MQVYEYYKTFSDRGDQAEVAWQSLFASYSKIYPDLAVELKRRLNGVLPESWSDSLPTYSSKDASVATRKTSELLLNRIAPLIPELIGGSADLTGSNLTRWKGAVDFQSVIYISLIKGFKSLIR